MAYEVFIRPDNRGNRGDGFFVAFTKVGVLTFSSALLPLLNTYSHVQFLVDKEALRIAVRPTEDIESAYKLSRPKGKSTASCSGIHIAKHLAIQLGRRYSVEIRDGLITFFYGMEDR